MRKGSRSSNDCSISHVISAMTDISSKVFDFLAHLSHPMIALEQKKSSPSKLGNSFLHSAIADITISLKTVVRDELL